MMQENTTKIFEILFSETANEVAQEVNFIQRHRNITGDQFSKTIILGLLENPNASRTELVSIAATVGDQIKPQSLDARLHSEESTAFFKSLLDKVLSIAWLQDKASLPESLTLFHDIILTDASIVRLPDVLEDLFSTGRKPEGQRAAAKIHARYSVVTKQVTIVLTPAQIHDQNIEWIPNPIVPNQLFLMDLGYYKLDSFEQIDNANGYFITRYKTGTCLYTDLGEKIDLSTYLGKNDWFDIAIEMGARKRIKGRLVGTKISEEKANERRRVLKRYCQKQGRQPSAESLFLCGYTVLLTNISSSELAQEVILNLVRVRWQIELLFKCWKSHLNRVNTWRSSNRSVILCMFYAKLLGCLVQQWLYLEACWARWNQSLFKSVKSIQRFIPELMKCVCDVVKCEKLLIEMKESLLVCTVSKRQNTPTCYLFDLLA